MMNVLQTLTIATLFVAAPLEEIVLLDKNARLDLIDFYEAGMPAKVTNNLGGTTEMIVLTDSVLHLRMTDVSDIEIQLVNDSTIALTHTYKLPEQEVKNVKKLSTSWEAIQ